MRFVLLFTLAALCMVTSAQQNKFNLKEIADYVASNDLLNPKNYQSLNNKVMSKVNKDQLTNMVKNNFFTNTKLQNIVSQGMQGKLQRGEVMKLIEKEVAKSPAIKDFVRRLRKSENRKQAPRPEPSA
jgi:hypothetical protein